MVIMGPGMVSLGEADMVGDGRVLKTRELGGRLQRSDVCILAVVNVLLVRATFTLHVCTATVSQD